MWLRLLMSMQICEITYRFMILCLFRLNCLAIGLKSKVKGKVTHRSLKRS